MVRRRLNGQSVFEQPVLTSALVATCLCKLLGAVTDHVQLQKPPVIRVRMYELEAGPASEGTQAVRVLALIQDCCKSSLLLGYWEIQAPLIAAPRSMVHRRLNGQSVFEQHAGG